MTTEAEVRASAGSWYTYCENNMALAEAKSRDLSKVAFVGVPCQITPLRKMEHMDPTFLVTGKKRPKPLSRQREHLQGFAERVGFSIGLFCTEVFTHELMTERIEQKMGIPLSEVKKFNVKGEVLIYKRDGDVATIPLQEAMAEYQRPECQHCGDFSAEMADIACGGVGTDAATIVVIRNAQGRRGLAQVSSRLRTRCRANRREQTGVEYPATSRTASARARAARHGAFRYGHRLATIRG